MGFDAHQITHEYATALNKVEEVIPSKSDVAKEDDIELQEITENAVKHMENLNAQLEEESSEDLPMHELLSLDRQLKRIRGLLKVEMANKVELQQCIEREKHKLEEIRDNPEYNDDICEDIRKQIAKLNDVLRTRQESINLLKSRLTNQITHFKETITKVLDKTRKDTDDFSGGRNYNCFYWNSYWYFG